MKPRNTIGDASRFYGYIVGLGVTLELDDDLNPNPSMYALFEYNGEMTAWIVRDLELFSILNKHLSDMAWHANEGKFGYSKLWIEKKNGKWVVELP